MTVKLKEKFVPLTNDILFKDIFGNEKNIRFLEDLLECYFGYEKGYLKNKLHIHKETILDKFTTKVTSKSLGKELKPAMENISDPEGINNADSTIYTYLVLSQTTAANNADQQLYYDNIAELIETHNDVGRRMAYSIAGNQDPQDDAREVDSSRAKPSQITVSFGKLPTYIAVAVTALVIIGLGAFIIKKKVLKK